MNHIILESLKPYANLHAQMDDIEERVYGRLRELFITDLAKFTVELK